MSLHCCKSKLYYDKSAKFGQKYIKKLYDKFGKLLKCNLLPRYILFWFELAELALENFEIALVVV